MGVEVQEGVEQKDCNDLNLRFRRFEGFENLKVHRFEDVENLRFHRFEGLMGMEVQGSELMESRFQDGEGLMGMMGMRVQGLELVESRFQDGDCRVQGLNCRFESQSGMQRFQDFQIRIQVIGDRLGFGFFVGVRYLH